jgi:Mg2+-importing ATPase
LVVLVLRTRGPFWRSRASVELTLATATIVAAAVALPFTPLGRVFGFVPLPAVFLGLMGLIVASYIGCAELLKGAFYRKNRRQPLSAQTTVPP